MNPEPHARARVAYVRTEDGGRQGPVFSGYRGQFHYDGERNVAWDAMQTFPGRDQVLPGESVDCDIWFLSPQLHAHRLSLGGRFQIQEGGRIVAQGVITEILNQRDANAT
jgi:translation elongation factor EF-Tu-like GTPase